MESKHTPGPWRVEEGTTLVWGACNPDDTYSYGMGYPIAEARISPCSSWAKGPSVDDGIANARLIAAAPEMLKALKLVLSRELNLAEARDYNPPADMEIIAELEWAIAKAEGLE